jgi:hypothetical protein
MVSVVLAQGTFSVLLRIRKPRRPGINISLQSRAQTPVTVSPIGKMPRSSQAEDSPATTEQRVPVTRSKTEEPLAAKGGSVEEVRQFHENAENIRRRLKVHYLRTRPDMEAKELLYGKIASGM